MSDLDTVALLRAVSLLNAGRDLVGNTLNGSPSFCPGALIKPDAEDLDSEIAWTEQKVDAGARFFHTQAVFEPAPVEHRVGTAGAGPSA